MPHHASIILSIILSSIGTQLAYELVTDTVMSCGLHHFDAQIVQWPLIPWENPGKFQDKNNSQDAFIFIGIMGSLTSSYKWNCTRACHLPFVLHCITLDKPSLPSYSDLYFLAACNYMTYFCDKRPLALNLYYSWECYSHNPLWTVQCIHCSYLL